MPTGKNIQTIDTIQDLDCVSPPAEFWEENYSTEIDEDYPTDSMPW
jgi:hypothetical protein